MNLRPHSRHSRRRRILWPSRASRESRTFWSGKLQNGHTMASFADNPKMWGLAEYEDATECRKDAQAFVHIFSGNGDKHRLYGGKPRPIMEEGSYGRRLEHGDRSCGVAWRLRPVSLGEVLAVLSVRPPRKRSTRHRDNQSALPYSSRSETIGESALDLLRFTEIYGPSQLGV